MFAKINSYTKNFPMLAPVILRIALAGVFMWFGVSQIAHGANWTSLVPSWAADFSGYSAIKLVHMNGAMEVVGALFLALGILVRPVAFILFAHLLVITSHLGLSAIGVRDFGLSFATLAVAFYGEDSYCLLHKEESGSAV